MGTDGRFRGCPPSPAVRHVRTQRRHSARHGQLVGQGGRRFNAYSAETLNRARTHGLVSHAVWLRVTNPGEDPSAEVLGVDTWSDTNEMNQFYDLGIGYDHLGPVFAGQPATSTWESAPGHWEEW